jgi:glutamine synthetase
MSIATVLRDDIRPLVRRLGKLPGDWQREDLVRLCLADGIRVLNLHYAALDGKLKELRVPVNSRAYVERILAAGERVDGSSAFPGLLDAGRSDLYVVPVYRWAFLNPWAGDELDIVCRFAGRDGGPCAETPDNILFAAATRLERSTGLSLHALAELEFYLILERGDERFKGRSQRNYQQGAPYLHGRRIANEVLRVVSAVTGGVKYGHSEVGYCDRLDSDDPELDGRRVEQYEIEFDLLPVEELACWIEVARWLVRCIADRHGASATFVPKLHEDMAGSGMHLHLALYRGQQSVMLAPDGGLSEDALRLIGGVLGRARPLAAFGNTVAASYLRLVPNQEAPTRACWGFHNRSSLIRVPLSFDLRERPDLAFNPGEQGAAPSALARPTVELRSPDGSAFINPLLAAITLSAEAGLRDPDSAALAHSLRVEGNLFEQPDVLARLDSLPATAVEAGAVLGAQRAWYEQRGFPPRLIDIVIGKLLDEDDVVLSEQLLGLPPEERLKHTRWLMHRDLHKL